MRQQSSPQCDLWCGTSTQRHSLFPWKKWTGRDKGQLSLFPRFLVLSLYCECLISIVQQQQVPVFILKGCVSKKHTLAASNSVSRNDSQLWAMFQENIPSSLCRIYSYSIWKINYKSCKLFLKLKQFNSNKRVEEYCSYGHKQRLSNFIDRTQTTILGESPIWRHRPWVRFISTTGGEKWYSRILAEPLHLAWIPCWWHLSSEVVLCHWRFSEVVEVTLLKDSQSFFIT